MTDEKLLIQLLPKIVRLYRKYHKNRPLLKIQMSNNMLLFRDGEDEFGWNFLEELRCINITYSLNQYPGEHGLVLEVGDYEENN